MDSNQYATSVVDITIDNYRPEGHKRSLDYQFISLWSENPEMRKLSENNMIVDRAIELANQAGFTDWNAQIEVDDEIDQEWQKTKPRGARVTVQLRSGEVYTECVHMLRSMTAEEVNDKFRRLATVAVSTERCEQLVTLVRNLETVRDISFLAPLLTR